MRSVSDRELAESEQRANELKVALLQRRISRRKVLTGASVIAAGGILSAACGGGSSSATATPGGTATAGGGGATAGGTAMAGGTAAAGAASGVGGQIPAALQRYQYVDQYNWRRLNWGGTPYTGGTLQVAGFPPANFDLMTTETLTQFPPYMNGLYYSALHAGVNLETAAVEPDLAQSVEHTPDYLRWTFKLPQNVYFHDLPPVNGAQMTSADVKFSFERYIDTSLWNVPLSEVDHIDAPDDYTVTFVLKQPKLQFPAVLALPYYQIFNPDHFADHERFQQQVIGTGAFVLQDSKYLVSSHAVRNPKYWGTSSWLDGHADVSLPFVDAYDATYFADPASLDAGLRGKSIDAADLEGSLPSRIEDLLKANSELVVTTDAEWALTPRRVFLNWKNELFQDVRVRRALSMALDRETIVKVAFGGAGVAASSPVPYDQMGLDGPPTMDQMGQYFQYDPAGARQLLAEAGHTSLRLKAIQDQTGLASWMPLVQKYWKDIGVDLTIDTVPVLQLSTSLQKGDFDIILSNFAGSVLGYDIDDVLRPMFYPDSPNNYASVNDPDLTKIMDQIHASTNPDELMPLAKQAFDTFNQNMDVIYVCGYHTWYATQPWVHTIANTYYTTIGNYASANYRNVWVDDTAPGGRGGKAVA